MVNNLKANKHVHKEFFNNVEELIKYVEETKVASIWKGSMLGSRRESNKQTESFEEAKKLALYGWEVEAEELTIAFKLANTKKVTKIRMKHDVIGFQASVPRYLQGIPTSMYNQKKVLNKTKIITIIKNIGYLWDVSSEKIREESIKALQIVRRLEQIGYKVNLDVISIAEQTERSRLSVSEYNICRVRIKKANERINISKLAFPLVHSDMLRRFVFAHRETNENLKNKQWVYDYGMSIIKKHFYRFIEIDKHEYIIDNFIKDVETELNEIIERI